MNTSPTSLKLKPKRHFPFVSRHPWVHAHSLADEGKTLAVGDLVDVVADDGGLVGRGLINPNSKLRIRLYGYDRGVNVGEDLFRTRIDAAIARRRMAGPPDGDAGERLIFSESDLLSGLIVDRYADTLSVVFTSAALACFRRGILEHLPAAVAAAGTPVRGMMVQMDSKTARLEGVDTIAQWIGEGEPLANYIENGLKLHVDLSGGQKTGGYLDQRCNHAAAAKYLVGKTVLDVCCYHGGFGLVAAVAGAAAVTGLDSSLPALEMADKIAKDNQIANVEFLQGDCFDVLEDMGRDGKLFDAVILDPPRFAGSRHQTDSALRAYHRLNAAAVRMINPGGILVSCSCSGRISNDDFTQVLGDVGRTTRRDIVILENRGAAADHPVAAGCPESRYLKCVIATVH